MKNRQERRDKRQGTRDKGLETRDKRYALRYNSTKYKKKYLF